MLHPRNYPIPNKGRGTYQYVPFNSIIWVHIKNNSCFLGIGPIFDIDIICIF